MAVSGTAAFTLTANQIIEKAYSRLGKGTEGEAISARMYQDGKLSLNLIIKSRIGTSDRLSLRTEGTLALVSGQPSYVMTAPFPLRIMSVRRKSAAGYDVPLNALSRQEYFDLPNKTASPSTPVSYYFDPQSADGVLYLWPCPDSNAASQYTLDYTYLRRIDDIDNPSDMLDLPEEWLDPIVWILADDLELEYPVNDPRLAMKISAKADEAKQILDYFDTENASVFMQPDPGA